MYTRMYSAYRRSGLELELQAIVSHLPWVLGIDLSLDPLEEQDML